MADAYIIMLHQPQKHVVTSDEACTLMFQLQIYLVSRGIFGAIQNWPGIFSVEEYLSMDGNRRSRNEK